MCGPRSSGFRPSISRLGALAALLFILPISGLSAQAPFIVNNTGDADDGVCDATHCSLREAIFAANAAGGGVIAFDIPGAGPHTIRPLSGLPALMGDVILDASTEPDFVETPVIELDGTNAGGFTQGLSLSGSGNVIRGLVVNRFSDNGISIGSEAHDNLVEGCYIGTDVTGSLALGNGNAGVMIGQASNNTIGGTTPAARNVISGNPEGVTIVELSATGNVILGNYIGTNAGGTAAVPNHSGVLLLAPDNTVGGTSPGARNVIAGNTGNGVAMGPPNANGNLVVGNYIGLDASGTLALGNDIGVWVDNVADNTIGGTTAGARNVISGGREGITIWGFGATGNLVRGNFIGTNSTGDGAIPNQVGIPVYSPENTIGGTEAGAGNLISGNQSIGLVLFGQDAWGNTVQGNLIGTDATGAVALGNGEQGVSLVDAAGNTIGGTQSGAGNVLSGNVGSGVFLLGETTQDNLIQGNFIGTDPTGTTAIGNGDSGVAIHSAKNNLVSGRESGARNILSGNAFGVLIGDLSATGNRIQGNYIGVNSAGNAALPNTEIGVLCWGEANTIGGSETGEGNVISGNRSSGIGLGEGSSATVIEGNLIGTDATGMTALPNDLGIFVTASPDNTIGGTTDGMRNVISGNTGGNITVTGPTATGNVIQGNYIGTDITGSAVFENGRGIQILDAPDNIVGGSQAGAGNVISGNANGIRIEGPNASGNFVQGNILGTDVAGAAPLGNSGATIRLTNGAANNTIGGAEPGAGNIVANASWHGITLFADAGTGNRILSNSIYGNGALGIELGRNGVTPNDEGDVDTGPNNFQNYPVLTSVVSNGGAVVQAALNSSPSSAFTVDFFSSPECDDSGFGQGRTPLGTASLTTDASGNGTAVAAFASITGTVLTATATDADGNTSEFSQCGELTTLAVASAPATRTVAPGQPAVYTITATAQGGSFEETLALGCSGNPAGTTCTFDQDQVTLAEGQGSATMTVTTLAPAVSRPWAPGSFPKKPWAIWLAMTLLALALRGAMVGRVPTRGGFPDRWTDRIPMGLKASGVALLLLIPLSCGDDGNKPPSGGTPPGSYEITVTASWESASASATVTMVVQ